MRCEHCGGLIVDDQWEPGKLKCSMCGRRPIEASRRAGVLSEPEAGPEGRKTMVTNESKRCTKCGGEKLLGEFSKNRSTPDGLERWCKDCKGKQQQDYRDKHKGGGNGKKGLPRKYRRKTENTKDINRSVRKEPLTTASPEAIIAALRKGVAREIIQIIEERF